MKIKRITRNCGEKGLSIPSFKGYQRVMLKERQWTVYWIRLQEENSTTAYFDDSTA